MQEIQELQHRGHTIPHAEMKNKKKVEDSYNFSVMEIAPGSGLSDIT